MSAYSGAFGGSPPVSIELERRPYWFIRIVSLVLLLELVVCKFIFYFYFFFLNSFRRKFYYL